MSSLRRRTNARQNRRNQDGTLIEEDRLAGRYRAAEADTPRG
jgi:hypothetical protein